MEFYHERRNNLAEYEVEAALPTTAVSLGWKALLSAYPPSAARRGRSLFERAQRIEGQHASGWLLYRIANDTVRSAAAAARANAA